MVLRNLGGTHSEIAEPSGLSAREVGALIRLAEQPTDTDEAESAAEHESAVVGESEHEDATEHVA